MCTLPIICDFRGYPYPVFLVQVQDRIYIIFFQSDLQGPGSMNNSMDSLNKVSGPSRFDCLAFCILLLEISLMQLKAI